jgi:2-oxoglutarate ferredoxin oxidoreductase subunit beta
VLNYRSLAYDLGEDKNFDPADREAAFKKALEWEDRFPIGVIYRTDRPTMTDNISFLRESPLNRRKTQVRDIRPLVESLR